MTAKNKKKMKQNSRFAYIYLSTISIKIFQSMSLMRMHSPPQYLHKAGSTLNLKYKTVR